MTEKLKPCPFCGHAAIVYQCPQDERINRTLWNMWIVGCDGEILCPGYVWNGATIFTTKDAAVKAWNRRAEQKTKAEAEIIHCKDCEFFDRDVWYGPIIAAHNGCRKWGNGCATDPDGYCYMGKRKEWNNGCD